MKWKERIPMPAEPKPERPNEHESSIFAAELGETASVDLHGLNIEQAKHDLDAFLDREFMQGTEVVKIIHGRGEQKLRRMVEEQLKPHPLVEYWRDAQAPNQQAGVTYAVLARQ